MSTAYAIGMVLLASVFMTVITSPILLATVWLISKPPEVRKDQLKRLIKRYI